MSLVDKLPGSFQMLGPRSYGFKNSFGSIYFEGFSSHPIPSFSAKWFSSRTGLDRLGLPVISQCIFPLSIFLAKANI